MWDAAGRLSRSSTSCCCRRRRRSSSRGFCSRRCCTEPPGPRLPSGTALNSSTSPAASSRAICRTPTRLQLQNRKRRKLGPSRGATQGLRNPSLLPPEEDSGSEHLRKGRVEGGGLSLAHSGEEEESGSLLHPRPTSCIRSRKPAADPHPAFSSTAASSAHPSSPSERPSLPAGEGAAEDAFGGGLWDRRRPPTTLPCDSAPVSPTSSPCCGGHPRFAGLKAAATCFAVDESRKRCSKVGEAGELQVSGGPIQFVRRNRARIRLPGLHRGAAECGQGCGKRTDRARLTQTHAHYTGEPNCIPGTPLPEDSAAHLFANTVVPRNWRGASLVPKLRALS